jgi:negative regulator of sigma E activity
MKKAQEERKEAVFKRENAHRKWLDRDQEVKDVWNSYHFVVRRVLRSQAINA